MGVLRNLLADTGVQGWNESVRCVLGDDHGEANNREGGKDAEENCLAARKTRAEEREVGSEQEGPGEWPSKKRCPGDLARRVGSARDPGCVDRPRNSVIVSGSAQERRRLTVGAINCNGPCRRRTAV